MKRRYKLLLIVLSGMLITFLINISTNKEQINLVALGDSFALGYIDNKIVGISFNDYLKESINNLDSLNNEFCIRNITISSLNNLLDKNTLGKKTNIPIKQIINQADILTIAIGIDEFNYYNNYYNVDDNIDIFLDEYTKLIDNIRTFYSKKIIIISLYPFNGITNNTILKINNGLKDISIKYKAIYLDIMAYSLNNEYFYTKDSIYLNYRAHKNIAKCIVEQINS